MTQNISYQGLSQALLQEELGEEICTLLTPPQAILPLMIKDLTEIHREIFAGINGF